MSSQIRIRTGEVYTKQEVLDGLQIGKQFFELLRTDFGLEAWGTRKRLLFYGDNVIAALSREARGDKVEECQNTTGDT